MMLELPYMKPFALSTLMQRSTEVTKAELPTTKPQEQNDDRFSLYLYLLKP